MKTFSKNIFAVIALATTFSLSGCFENPASTDAEESLTATYTSAVNARTGMSCDDVARKTVRTYNRTRGTIAIVRQDGQQYYLINAAEIGKKFQLCQLPEAYRHDGMRISFIGDEKEMFRDEKWLANPFVVKWMAKM